MQDGHANPWSLIVLMRMPSLGVTSTYQKRKPNQSSACPLFSTTCWRYHSSPLLPPHPFPALPLFHTHTYIITGHHVSWKQSVWGNVHTEQSGLADGSHQPGMLSLLYSFPCFSFLLYMYTYLLIRLLLLFQYILNSYDRWRSRLKTSYSSMSRFVSSRKRWGNLTQINHLALLTTLNKLIYQSGSSYGNERRKCKEGRLIRQRNSKRSWKTLLTWFVMRFAVRKSLLCIMFLLISPLPARGNSSLIHQTEWDIWKHGSHHALLEQFRGNTAETRMDEPPSSRRSLLGDE